MMTYHFMPLPADISTWRELSPYQQQPRAMYVGTPGKQGRLHLAFELDSQGKSILRYLDRRAPLIVQQALYFDENWPELPCVYILSSGGPNVDGDRYELQIKVGTDAFAHLSTGAATKLAGMRYNYASMTQHIVLDEGAYLEFLPEPVIPCRHTRFASDTRLTVHPTATICYAEIFTGGRKHHAGGEHFDYDLLAVNVQGQRPDGEWLFKEKFVSFPSQYAPTVIGVMDGYEVWANVVVITPSGNADAIYSATEAFILPDGKLAAGITRLPGACGLLYKVLGHETGPVKRQVRKFCSSVRQVVKGCPLPEEFPWR